MSFGLFSLPVVLGGIAALALGLWLAQRLRVRHREVEVISTLFWREALEETRARIFVRRFRHWWAWLLLVAITSLMWMLLSQPERVSWDRSQHVILVDWSVEDEQQRARELQMALDLAATLPVDRREIIAVTTRLETLLFPGEPLQLAASRSQQSTQPAPPTIDWALDALAGRAVSRSPLTIHLIGDTPVDHLHLEAITAASNRDQQILRVQRVSVERTRDSVELVTLGVSESADGSFENVDLWLDIIDPDGQPVAAERIRLARDSEPIDQPLVNRQDGLWELAGIPADGSTLTVAADDRDLGTITLPLREPIRVQLEPDVPESLQQLVRLDPACRIVSQDAEVIIGSSPQADFRLSAETEPAIVIESDEVDQQQALSELVDELALQQIDATAIAQQAGQIVEVQSVSGTTRSFAIWRRLFSSSFDFQESRACPIVVARTIRWLARHQPLVEWVALGERLPVAATPYTRADQVEVTTEDGRRLRAARLTSRPLQAAELIDSAPTPLQGGLSLYSGLGLLLVLLLIAEWVTFQKGHMP